MSCGMFSIERGARTNYSFVAEVLKTACATSLEINLLVDSSKFIKAGAFLIKKTSDITRVITDKNLNQKIISQFNKIDTELVI